MNNSTKIVAAIGLGVIAGSVLGLLFAPNKGYETRKKIADESGKVLKKIKGEWNKEKLSKIKDKLENKLKKVNSKIAQFSKEESTPA